MKNTKTLYAVELDISREAGEHDYWVIHREDDGPCVYETYKEAKDAAKGRDHKSRVVKFTRTTHL